MTFPGNSKLAIGILLSVIVAISFGIFVYRVTYTASKATVKVSPSPTPHFVEDTTKSQTACKATGGIWKSFPNACADVCGASNICAQVLTDSCDCGAAKCWSDGKCVPN